MSDQDDNNNNNSNNNSKKQPTYRLRDQTEASGRAQRSKRRRSDAVTKAEREMKIEFLFVRDMIHGKPNCFISSSFI
jgi:hypothetical protein